MGQKEPTEVFPWARFLTVWILVIQLWTRATKLAVAGSQLALFSAALIALRDDGKLTHPCLDNAPPEPQTPPSKSKAAKQLTKNLSFVCSAEDKIDRLLDGGVIVVYTDGLAEYPRHSLWYPRIWYLFVGPALEAFGSTKVGPKGWKHGIPLF